MAFDLTPTRPLGKIFTLGLVVNTIVQWLQKETQQELNPEFVKTLVNVAVGDVAEFLSGAGSDDYGKTADITDISSSVTEDLVTDAAYVESAKRIDKTAHGLTSDDIGKRIVYYKVGGDPLIVIAEIESIVSANAFTVTKPAGENIANVSYAVFSAHSSETIDLSLYRIANITKIYDSISKEVTKVGDREFDNHHRFPEKQKQIIWFRHGQYLYLKKGTAVTAYGTLTMYYNSYPQVFTDDNSLMDVKDNYISLVIATAKNYCYEHLQMTAPESLTQIIDAKKREARENIQREKGIIEQKNVTAKKTG